MNPSSTTLDDVKRLFVDTLGIGHRAPSLTPDTQLLDSVPELDSMAILELVAVLEGHFGILFDDADVNEDSFATLASLAALVDAKGPPSGS